MLSRSSSNVILVVFLLLVVIVVLVSLMLGSVQSANVHWCRNYDDLLAQANTWEQNGEYTRAIDFYLQLNTDNCNSQDILLKSWNKVCLHTRFIPLHS